MLAAIAVTVFILLVPGTLLGWASGLRSTLALASAGPLTLGVVGFSAWLSHALGLDYSWLFVMGIWAWFCAVGYLVRRFLPRATPEDGFDSGVVTAMIVAGVTVVGSVRAMLMLNDVPGGPGAIREAWDMLWHTNFLRFIDEVAIASPTAAGDLMNQETGAEMFYPTGWHAVAGLLPGSVFLDSNVFAFLAPALLLPAATAVLARTAVGPKWAAYAGPAAAVATLMLPEVWVALWRTSSMPYLLAVAALPIAVALTMRGYIIPATLALVGTFITHPAAAFAAIVFVVLRLITQPSVSGLARTLVIGVLTFAMTFPVVVAAKGQGESVAGFTGQIEISRSESLWWSLIGSSSYADEANFSLVVLVLMLIGLVVALVSRLPGSPWAPWPALAFGLFFMVSDSAQSRWSEPAGGIFKLVGTFFYDMPYRIQAVMGILRAVLVGYAVAAAVVAIVAVAQWIVAKRNEPARAWNPALAVGIVAALAIVPTTWVSGPAQREAIRASFGNMFVTAADREAIGWLSKQPHAFEGHILNDRRDGSAWMYAIAGLPTLFRHFSFPDKTAEVSKKLPPNVDLLGADSKYDAMARKLGVHYIISSPPGVNTDGTEALSMRSWAWHSPGLTPVYHDGSVMIFAVNAMFSPAELKSIVKGSPHRPARPNPLWMPPRQPILPSPDEAVDPLVGARITVDSSRAAIDAINSNLPGELQLSEKSSPHIDSIVKRARTKLRQRGAIIGARSLADGTASAATVIVGRSSEGKTLSGDNIGDRGFSVSAVVNSPVPKDDAPADWQLAAGVRDGMVFRGFNPHSSYSASGVPTEFRTGLAPAVAANPSSRPHAPTVALSLGAVGAATLTNDLADPAMQDKWADAIVDGVASMLRQNRQLVTVPKPQLISERAGVRAR
ncbi:DUF6541 family protein [uncultured Corynebacterium sp.]|uniref:DUF6541 family protein n=1 Tax=uncultured Corynebacterium sp. TaxID=159447 RepID=UPI002625B9C4|nr:DUF6541 family protein [uncultured Corynebacterium sp.]